MDDNLKIFLEKAKLSASKLAEKTVIVADMAGKKASDFAAQAKLNMQIFDLNTENEILFKELGQMCYDGQNGIEVSSEAVDVKIELIREKLEKINALKQEIEEMKALRKCPICNKECSQEDTFCAGCGAQL